MEKCTMRVCDVVRGFIYCLFGIMSFYGAVQGETTCGSAMKQYSLMGASLCYNTSAIGNIVVLDGFQTQQSQETKCKCAVTSTEPVKVSFSVLNNLQPDNSNCGSTLNVGAAGSNIAINCFVFGSLSIQSSQAMSVSFDKPPYSYNSNYCILLTPDNTSAVLTLKCEGDLMGSSGTTSKTETTTSKTTTITSTVKTTTLTTTAAPVTSTVFKTTTSQRPTQSSQATATETQRTTRAPTEQTTTHSTVQTTAHSTVQTTAHSTVQTPAPSTVPGSSGSAVTPKGLSASTTEWIYIIPAAGAGFILICAIAVAVCYTQRKKRRNLNTQRNSMYAFENKASSPYSSDFNAGSGMVSKLSTSIKSTDIKAVIVDDVRDDVSESTNVSEGTFVRHSVRQPIIRSEVPVYAVVDKSTNGKPGTDAKYDVFDKSDTQENQSTEMEADIIY